MTEKLSGGVFEKTLHTSAKKKVLKKIKNNLGPRPPRPHPRPKLVQGIALLSARTISKVYVMTTSSFIIIDFIIIDFTVHASMYSAYLMLHTTCWVSLSYTIGLQIIMLTYNADISKLMWATISFSLLSYTFAIAKMLHFLTKREVRSAINRGTLVAAQHTYQVCM